MSNLWGGTSWDSIAHCNSLRYQRLQMWNLWNEHKECGKFKTTHTTGTQWRKVCHKIIRFRCSFVECTIFVSDRILARFVTFHSRHLHISNVTIGSIQRNVTMNANTVIARLLMLERVIGTASYIFKSEGKFYPNSFIRYIRQTAKFWSFKNWFFLSVLPANSVGNFSWHR